MYIYIDPTLRRISLHACKQKAWDTPIVDGQFSLLLTINSNNPTALAHLHVCCPKESGAWLTAPHVAVLRLKMANETIRIAVGQRLGAPLCAPHSCSLCGKPVDVLGTHGLSCRQSKGRIPRHNGLNTIIKQALASAHISFILEPQGLVQSNNKQTNGLTIIPWANGCPLVWNATVWDSFAPSTLLYQPLLQVWRLSMLPGGSGRFTRSYP